MQRKVRALACLAGIVVAAVLAAPAPAAVHVWEKQELTFTSARSFANPYTDAVVWVDLTGPGFKKRVYGFWDGGRTFACACWLPRRGRGSWRSGSNPADPGLAGKSGSFTAIAWTEEEKQQNPLRRGFLRSTPNHHALEQADGTPFFVIGDTWYSVGTNRFVVRRRPGAPVGPTAGFKDYVRYRKAQGYNWVNIIAAFPNWITDGEPWNVVMNDPERTTVRSAWLEFGADSAKNMDNEGGRPFLFPGKVPGYENMFPDVDRINPEYFQYVDRKIDYLNEQGFVALHRGIAPRRQPVLEEVLPVARILRALHPVHLVPLPGQQHGAQPGSPGHHQRNREPGRFPGGDPLRDGEVRAAAVRHAAFGQRQSIDAGELGRRFLGDAAPDRQHARAQQLLVPDGDLPLAASAAGSQRRAYYPSWHISKRVAHAARSAARA